MVSEQRRVAEYSNLVKIIVFFRLFFLQKSTAKAGDSFVKIGRAHV